LSFREIVLTFLSSCSYPSGRLAVSIVKVRPGLFTYILQKDFPKADIVAVFQPSGHGVIYYDNGLPRSVMYCALQLLSAETNMVENNWTNKIYS